MRIAPPAVNHRSVAASRFVFFRNRSFSAHHHNSVSTGRYTTPIRLHHVKARKMKYFGYILRQPKDSIEHAVVTGLTEGSRIRGRPRTSWIDNIFQWSRLRGSRWLETARDRQHWHEVVRHRSQQSHSDVGDVTWHDIIMFALCNRADHYIFPLWFLSIFFLFSSPNLSGRRLDIYHTSTHGVALVRI